MAESVAFFAVKSIGLSAVNGRKPCNLLNAARHNLREIQAEQGSNGRIDAARTAGNVVLQGPPDAAQVHAQALALLSGAGIEVDKLRRDHCQAIEAVFSLPPDVPQDRAQYFAQCLAWLSSALSLPVLSAVVHTDESAAHMHVLLLPMQDGEHVGSAPIAREHLKRLRNSFFAQVAGPAGLQRMGAKVQGAHKQRAIAAVLRQCESMGLIGATGPLWPVLLAAIERDPVPTLRALGMDPAALRHATAEPQRNPIGIETNPIGIENKAGPDQTLSLCRVHSQNRPPAAPAPAAAPAAQRPQAVPTPTSSTTAPATPASAPINRCDEGGHSVTPLLTPLPIVTTRVRDADLQASQWCPERGEFRPPAPPRPRQKEQAQAWVRSALARAGTQARAP